MLPEETEQLRTDIWDLLFEEGPMSVQQLSECSTLSTDIVQDAVKHPWFSVDGEVVSIATVDSDSA